MTTPARAETVELRQAGRLTSEEVNAAIDAAVAAAVIKTDAELDPVRFMTDRRGIDHCNMLKREVRQCTDAISSCWLRECGGRELGAAPLLGEVGLPAIIVGAVVVFAGAVAAGIAIGIEASRLRPATAAP